MGTTTEEFYALDFGDDPDVQELLKSTPSESLTYTVKFLPDDSVLVRLNGMLFEGQIRSVIGTDFFLRAEGVDSHTPLATATKRIVLKQFVCPLPSE